MEIIHRCILYLSPDSTNSVDAWFVTSSGVVGNNGYDDSVHYSYGQSSPGINSVIFYYGSYLIDELGNGDANGVYDSYGHKNTGVKS